MPICISIKGVTVVSKGLASGSDYTLNNYIFDLDNKQNLPGSKKIITLVF